MYCHIDIETRSECKLKTEGLMNYSKDKTTQLLCIEMKVEGKLHTNNLNYLMKLAADDQVIFVAHNVSFEFLMLHRFFWWFDVPIERWICTAVLCAYHRLPRSLGASAKVLGLAKQKDEEGKAVMRKMSKPLPEKQWKKNSVPRGVVADLEDTFGGDYSSEKFLLTHESLDTLESYCEDDVLTEEAIFDRLDPIPEHERQTWILDFKMNWFTGVKVDLELCTKAIKLFDQVADETNAKCMAKYGFKLTQVKDIAEFLGTPKADAPTIKAVLENPDAPEEHREVCEWRQLVGNTSPAKFKAILNFNYKGVLYGMMLFCGAGTRRWTSKQVQLQNLARGSLDEDWVDEEMEACVNAIKTGTTDRIIETGMMKNKVEIIKSTVRGAFCGNLTVCDFSQIEARVLAWLAGQQDVVDAFRDGLDIYKVAASQIYRVKYEDVTKDQRFIGKIAVLALGYGGSVGAFLGMAEQYGVKGMDEDFVKGIVYDWRSANTNIKSWWYDVESAAMKAVNSGRGSARNVEFYYKNDFLRARMISGGDLWFYKPDIRTNPKFGNESISYLKQLSQNDYPIKGTTYNIDGAKIGRVFTYGGKLVENVTQGLARDIMVNSMKLLPDHAVSFTVHDEIICRDTPLDVVTEAMTVVPDWAEGLPVGADGWEGKRYRK